MKTKNIIIIGLLVTLNICTIIGSKTLNKCYVKNLNNNFEQLDKITRYGTGW